MDSVTLTWFQHFSEASASACYRNNQFRIDRLSVICQETHALRL
jgi:hypothetical protein